MNTNSMLKNLEKNTEKEIENRKKWIEKELLNTRGILQEESQMLKKGIENTTARLIKENLKLIKTMEEMDKISRRYHRKMWVTNVALMIAMPVLWLLTLPIKDLQIEQLIRSKQSELALINNEIEEQKKLVIHLQTQINKGEKWLVEKGFLIKKKKEQ